MAAVYPAPVFTPTPTGAAYRVNQLIFDDGTLQSTASLASALVPTLAGTNVFAGSNTFSAAIVASGGVTGNVSGTAASLSGVAYAGVVFTYTPPTSSTDVLTVSGVALTVTFDSSATQTVTDLKAQVAANATLAAIWTVTGTTTAVFTSKAPGQTGVSITDAASHSASLAFNHLGSTYVAIYVNDASASTTLAGVLAGDYALDATTIAKSGLCVAANTVPTAFAAHDVVLILRAF